MNDEPRDQPDRQLELLQELVQEHAIIDGDILEIDPRTWAVHGSIAVDGEVIMAEYDTQDKARNVLDKLSSADDGTVTP
jgi:hypothetical protein